MFPVVNNQLLGLPNEAILKAKSARENVNQLFIILKFVSIVDKPIGKKFLKDEENKSKSVIKNLLRWTNIFQPQDKYNSISGLDHAYNFFKVRSIER